jgi:ubiquinol-cytochrome c reductase cytochrome b/c1 subunit
MFWFFVVNCLLLGWIGGNPVKYPYYEVGQFCTILYFVYIVVFIPLSIKIEEIFWGRC